MDFRNLLVSIAALFFLAVACGDGDSRTYTEKDYREAVFRADCTRYEECDKEFFDKDHSSIDDCVTYHKEEEDTDSEDTTITYAPFCEEGSVFNPDAAKKHVECIYDQSCVSWKDGNSELCNIYMIDTCLESCEGYAEGYMNCLGDAIFKCIDNVWQRIKNCDTASEEHCSSDSGEAGCIRPNSYCSEENHEQFCIGAVLFYCDPSDGSMLNGDNCKEQGKECDEKNGCV